MVPDIRLRALNPAPVNVDRPMVLYWMTAARRTRASFALERAAGLARELGKPLVVLEALRAGYEWASDRFHQFAIEGMRDNRAALDGLPGVTYFPYLEPTLGEGRGLLGGLAAHAAVVVTDDYPAFFLPAMTRAAAHQLDVRLEAVDGNGLLPMRAVDAVFPTAHAFRRALQRTLPRHLAEKAVENPLAEALTARAWPIPPEVAQRWPDGLAWFDGGGSLEHLPIDHDIVAAPLKGGSQAAAARLRSFLDDDFARYADERNVPDREGTTRLSPYLHWGHLGAREIFDAVMAREGWLGDVPARATGAREGWWGVSPAADALLDQLVTWRELGFNMSWQRDDVTRFESLPAWARATLDKHAGDPRSPVYSLEQFETAETHDPLWNAAQRQLVREGRIHNYLRMLWGKKILQWSASPRDALAVMIELNNAYALDGRDPNSYSGIFWVLGRYDRPWGPERPIFGTIRYMTSENTARKVRVREYLDRYAP